jgi:predicted metal-dependent phosphoesterase TrpH
VLIDLHVHSSRTLNVPFSLKELVQKAREAGLDALALTDVHTVGGLPEARELSESEGLLVLVGFEAHTTRGHFLVFVPEPEKLPDLSNWLRFNEQGRCSYTSLFEAVERLDGILIAAHPFDRSVPESPGDSVVRLEGVAAVEVLNASKPTLSNELAEEVAAGAGLPGTGGSNAHDSLDQLGRYATLVRGPVQSEADLIDRIREYDAWPVSIGQPAFPPPPKRKPSSRETKPRGKQDTRDRSRDRDRGRDRGRGRERERERGRGRERGRERERGPGRGRPKKT